MGSFVVLSRRDSLLLIIRHLPAGLLLVNLLLAIHHLVHLPMFNRTVPAEQDKNERLMGEGRTGMAHVMVLPGK